MSLNYKWVFAVVLLGAGLARGGGPTLLLVNARVWTGDATRPWAEAVAITGERISAAGSSPAIRQLKTENTSVVDLGGRLVLPGFNDAHTHFLSGSLLLSQVDLTGASSIAEMQRRIAAWAKSHPAAAWITGSGWEYTPFPGGLPNKRDLDAATNGRPAFIEAYDGHTGWANSAALAKAGIRKGFEYKGFGGVVFDAGGEPTGALKESAQGLVRRLLPEPAREQKLAALREGMKMAARLGITSIQNASGGAGEISLYREMRDGGELTMRVALAASIAPGTKPGYVQQVAEWSREYNGKMLRVKAVKFVLDGVIEAHTAAMLDAYSDVPATSGSAAWTQAAYNEMLAQCDKDGLQIFTHAIGDRAVRMALDGYANMFRVNGQHDARPRVEHIETIAAADIPRFAALRVIASMMPIHADPGTSEVWSNAIGPDRAGRGFAWRSIERTGARLVFSSDWPATISTDPIRGLHCAVTRETVEGQPPGGWVPNEKVSLETAIRAYTAGGAYASFEEKEKGIIAPGMLADVVVLSRDIFRTPPAELYTARIVMTVVGGRTVFKTLE